VTEHVREVLIVAILVAACLGATFLEAHELGAMLGGAACALVVPRAGTVARSGVVIGAVVLASSLTGCASGPTPWKVAGVACDVVRVASLACGLLPAEPTSGGEASP
jgi:hypothetical protein